MSHASAVTLNARESSLEESSMEAVFYAFLNCLPSLKNKKSHIEYIMYQVAQYHPYDS